MCIGPTSILVGLVPSANFSRSSRARQWRLSDRVICPPRRHLEAKLDIGVHGSRTLGTFLFDWVHETWVETIGTFWWWVSVCLVIYPRRFLECQGKEGRIDEGRWQFVTVGWALAGQSASSRLNIQCLYAYYSLEFIYLIYVYCMLIQPSGEPLGPFEVHLSRIFQGQLIKSQEPSRPSLKHPITCSILVWTLRKEEKREENRSSETASRAKEGRKAEGGSDWKALLLPPAARLPIRLAACPPACLPATHAWLASGTSPMGLALFLRCPHRPFRHRNGVTSK